MSCLGTWWEVGGGITKGREETFGGDGCVHYLKSDADSMGVYIRQNISNYVC